MTPVEILKNTAQELRGDSVLGAVAAEIVKEVGESILQAELERVERQIEQRTAMDEECRWCSRQFCDMDGNVCVQRVTHNTALTDHANYIKSQIKAIKKLEI